MEFEEDFEYSSSVVGVHRSAGGAVTEEGQTDGDLVSVCMYWSVWSDVVEVGVCLRVICVTQLLVQPFIKPVDQFGVPSRTQDGESPLGGVEMVVDVSVCVCVCVCECVCMCVCVLE